MADETQGPGLTPLGKFISLVLILALIGVGGYIVYQKQRPQQAAPAGQTAAPGGGAKAVESEAPKVEAPDTAYFRLVSGLVEGELRNRLRYALRSELERLTADLAASGAVRLSVDRLELTRVLVEKDAITLTLDLAVAVR